MTQMEPLCIAVLLVAALFAGSTRGNTVHNVTSKTFKEVAGDSPFVILYFTDKDPGCEMCGLAYPKYVTASRLFPQKETRFLRTTNAALTKTLAPDTPSLPTVGFLSQSRSKARLMNEPITVDSLVSHIVARSDGRMVRPMRVSYELDLKSDNFHQIVMNENYYVIIFLHEDDSKFADKRELFEYIAKTFKNDYEIVMATLDRSQERDLSSQFAMLQLPALYWYDMTDKTKKRYGGQFEVKELVTFINDQTNLDRNPGGSLLERAGRVPHMEKLVAKHIEEIVRGENLTNVVKIFQKQAGSVKNNRRFAEYYGELVKAVKQRKGVRVLDDELTKISLSLSREELTPVETDDAVRRRNIVQKVIEEVTAFVSRDKERVRGAIFGDAKDGDKGRVPKDKKHLRDEL